MRKLGGSKKGAIELSIGTIVILVLSMSMLVLGLVLLRSIFSGATDIVSLTNDQITNEVSNLFGNDKELVVLPKTNEKEVKIGQRDAFGIGIKNTLEGDSSKDFSYEVSVGEIGRLCQFKEEDPESWISLGKSESFGAIASGDIRGRKVTFDIPAGTSPCDFRYRIDLKYDNKVISSDYMDIIIKA